MHLKQSLFATASAVLLIASNAQAQDAETDRESAIDRVLGTVTVTATKKKDVENVQDVPVAVTAFGRQKLQEYGQNRLYCGANVTVEQNPSN